MLRTIASSKNHLRTASVVLALLVAAFLGSAVFGQYTGAGFYPSYDDGWQYLFSFYFWSAKARGTGTLRNTEIPIEVGLDDLIKDYFSGSLRIESRKGRTNLGFDLLTSNSEIRKR